MRKTWKNAADEVQRIGDRLLLPTQALPILLTLLLASAINGALLLTRIAATREVAFLYLVWNLFLAWIPLGLAVAAHRIHTKVGRSSFKFWILSALWLLFLPNAHYIITDLIHLRPRPAIPIWVDMMLIVSFAWTGLLLGFLSLHLIHQLVTRRRGKFLGWIFVLAVLCLTGTGIYIGRFLRWNSWDVFVNPTGLLTDLVHAFGQPLSNPAPLAYSLLFTLFCCVAHATLHGLVLLRAPTSLQQK